MITRTTTVGTLKNYRYNLNASNNHMAYAMNKVITERYFNSYAEDPALATRCFQIRRSFQRANTQLTVNESISHKYDVAWQALDSVTTDLYKITGAQTEDASFKSIITALNDPDASGRNALGQSMMAKAKGIVQTMNSRYGENYVFSGADHLNVPFTWEAQKSPNYIAEPNAANPEHEAAFKYTIDKDANPGETDIYTDDPDLAVKIPLENGLYDKDYTKEIDDKKAAGTATDEELADPRYGQYLTDNFEGTNESRQAKLVPKINDNYDKNSGYKYLDTEGKGTDDESEARRVLCYRGVEVNSMTADDQKKLDYFTGAENRYVDLGLGFKEKDGEAISSTVFDSGLQGVYYLGGYGMEEYQAVMGDPPNDRVVTATVPNNAVSIVQRMSEILLKCDPDDGSWESASDEEEFYVLAQKYEDTISLIGQRYAEMDTQCSFLKDNSELLSDTASSLSLQITELEHVDPADAITEYMYARYVYDAALKVGNSVLSQSLMDYMSF